MIRVLITQRCSTLSRRWRGLAQISGGSTSCCYASANDGHTHACPRNERMRTASYARAPTQLSMRNALMHMQTPPSAHPTRPGKLRLTWRSTARIIRLARGCCTESTRPAAPCVARAAWLPRRSLSGCVGAAPKTARSDNRGARRATGGAAAWPFVCFGSASWRSGCWQRCGPHRSRIFAGTARALDSTSAPGPRRWYNWRPWRRTSAMRRPLRGRSRGSAHR
jgi:hypothetical protein